MSERWIPPGAGERIETTCPRLPCGASSGKALYLVLNKGWNAATPTRAGGRYRQIADPRWIERFFHRWVPGNYAVRGCPATAAADHGRDGGHARVRLRITVYELEVKALAERYLQKMVGELKDVHVAGPVRAGATTKAAACHQCPQSPVRQPLRADSDPAAVWPAPKHRVVLPPWSSFQGQPPPDRVRRCPADQIGSGYDPDLVAKPNPRTCGPGKPSPNRPNYRRAQAPVAPPSKNHDRLLPRERGRERRGLRDAKTRRDEEEHTA